MDGQRFDAWVRQIAGNQSRRGILRLLGAGLAGGLLGTGRWAGPAGAQGTCAGASCTSDKECCLGTVCLSGSCCKRYASQRCASNSECCSGICGPAGTCVCATSDDCPSVGGRPVPAAMECAAAPR